VASEPAPSEQPAGAPDERRDLGDIRRARPYALARGQLRTFAFRIGGVAILIALDICGLALALYLALALREVYYGNTPILWGVLWEAETDWLPFVSLVTVLVFSQARLYASRERRAGFGRVVSSLFLVALLTFAFGIGTGHEFSTFGLIPTTLVIACVLIGLFRASYDVVTREVFHMLGIRRRAVLVGEGEHLLHLYRTLGAGRSGIDYELLGVVSGQEETDVPLPRLGSADSLRAVLAAQNVDEVIVTDSDFGERELLELVDQAHRSGVRVRIAPRTTELLTEHADYVPGQGIPLFEIRQPVLVGADWALKRAFDVIVSLFVLVVGMPFWLAIAAAVKLTSHGPVLYRDRRVGLGEREFGMLKFRTMYADAAAQQAELEEANEAAGALFKIRDDPRVTRVGRFLRRFSLDEIPNVVNVLRGEMSLVGPRPLPTRDYQLLAEWHLKRYLVLPGMTGLWQISGRSNLSFDDLVRLDFYYLDNWSIWLDITILARTIPAVISQRGAY
jgi:exopolysaccharide biosynthesis polyprenyl glycosylphosphotransferase